MKLAYIFQDDAADPSVQSGRPASLLQEFVSHGLDVLRVFPIDVPSSGTDLAKKVGYRALGKFHRRDRGTDYLDALARAFSERTAGQSYDLVFSAGSEAVSSLTARAPITFCADATFANLVDYYWDFTGLSAEYLREGHAQERAALARAALAVYPSEWAARSAINDYGADPARVAVIPFGANMGSDNDRPEVMRWIDERPSSPLRLLFVGRHWDRKGGETVIATALCLIAHGHPVMVDIVGCAVPAAHHGVPWIHEHGLLDQRDPEDMAKLHRLYSEAHFLFVPSKAEAYGFTFTEASAFGVPAVSTHTGGISSAVREGQNGILLPLAATASDYADAIVATFQEPQRYRDLCRRSFTEFEQRLNWSAFCRRFFGVVHERLGVRCDWNHAPAAPVPVLGTLV